MIVVIKNYKNILNKQQKWLKKSIYLMENKIIKYKIELIKQIDSLQKDNLVC